MTSLRFLLAKAILKGHAPAVQGSEIHRTAWLGSGAHITGSRLGRYSYVGNFTTVINCQIGAFCSIASGCIVGGGAHPTSWVSSSPVFCNGRNVLAKNFAKHEFNNTLDTSIGNDVWIGSNSLVKAGVRIGDGAVIGMGSVLTKDVGDYEIWGGNPARIIRRRFDEDTSSQLSRTGWWDYDDTKLATVAPFFADIAEFIRQTRKS